MKYAIIAAGEGSRLASEGFDLPKPMVSLQGETLIGRLLGIFMRHNAEQIAVIINENSPLLEVYLHSLKDYYPLEIIRKSTPSSLHSAGEIFHALPEWEEVVLTTTDTVFREEEFSAFIADFKKNPQTDALMAVTNFIDDESPLFIETDDSFRITAFRDEETDDSHFVSGGVYCLRKNAIAEVAKALDAGTSRMRNFQRQLVENDLLVEAFPFSKIVDVDHVYDINTAELFLNEVALV